MIEICKGLMQFDVEFTCHETLNYDENDETCSTAESQHCAGALIFLEAQNKSHQMMRIMERLGYYNRFKLKMQSSVFKSMKEVMKSFSKNIYNKEM